MDDTITTEQSDEIVAQLIQLAEQISDWRLKNFSNLSPEDRSNLQLLVSSIRRKASDMNALLVGQKIESLQDNLKTIAQATDEAEKALIQIQDIRQIVNIATAIVRLASAAITLNPVAILDTANNLIALTQ